MLVVVLGCAGSSRRYVITLPHPPSQTVVVNALRGEGYLGAAVRGGEIVAPTRRDSSRFSIPTRETGSFGYDSQVTTHTELVARVEGEQVVLTMRRMRCATQLLPSMAPADTTTCHEVDLGDENRPLRDELFLTGRRLEQRLARP